LKNEVEKPQTHKKKEKLELRTNPTGNEKEKEKTTRRNNTREDQKKEQQENENKEPTNKDFLFASSSSK